MEGIPKNFYNRMLGRGCLLGMVGLLALAWAPLEAQVAEFLGDLDADSQTTVKDLVILQNHLNGSRPLGVIDAFFADLDQNGQLDSADYGAMLAILMGRTPPPRTPFGQIVETSPQHGEAGVALTRETIVRFSVPLGASVDIDDSVIRAEFGGELIQGQIHLSADRRALSLFYPAGLPPTARVRVTVSGDNLVDSRGLPMDLNGDGIAGGDRRFDFDTLTVTSFPSTAVCGRIFASDLATNETGSMFLNRPLAGVTITVDGAELSAVTDENGNFRLENAPAGRFFVHIDGRTVPNVEPPGAYYPVVGKAWTSTPGIETNIGEIYLPIIPPETLTDASMTDETLLEFSPDFVRENPKFDGVQVMVPADSLFSDDGSRGGMVGIAPVQPDRLPGAVASDLPIQDVITIQTDGATNFDVPAAICLPNLEDPLTGRKLSAGEKAALWSFNHDLGRFEIVGSMTVSDDGKLICTDDGVGVLAPGWHGSSTGTQGDGGSLRTVRRSRSKQEKPGKNDPKADPDNQVKIPCPDNPNRYIVLYKDRKRPKRNPEAKGGDPVYLHSGEFYEEVNDLRIVGREVDFIWSRKYRSATGRPTAQGNNWDFSYNIFIREEGDDFVLCDGNSREDTYTRSGDGVWTSAGFFRTLEQNFDGTFTLNFEHRGRWTFFPFDGRPEAGRVARIIERNGNGLTFEYDQQGRLTQIIDSLDRPIEVRYNDDGFISDVVDFSGRTLHYEYFGRNERGGNFGDLKSVTSPIVTGTPNGNDFPNGKTVSYTYTTGFEDARLNGNLVTITDGRRNDRNDGTFGMGPYLRNQYSAVTNPDDPNFDRIVRQVWGDPDDILDYVYVPLLPSNANRRAVVKTIVNDRRGLVKEYFYDELNRLVIFREYTGFAERMVPTTELTNRPEGKVRSDDPDFFQTAFEWNDEHLMVRQIMPNGTIQERIYEGDINPDAEPRTRANLVMTRLLPGTHQPAGDQSVIEERYEYDTDFNGCCGFNFVTRHTDGRGNVTTHDYDERGNRVRTVNRVSSVVDTFEYNEFGQPIAQTYPDNDGISRRDEMVHFADGHQRGYVQQVIRDVENFAYTSRFDYDLVGNVISVTDAKGHTKELVVNELNQVVREISREVRSGTGVRYRQDYFYDANNNLVRVDFPNLDQVGVVQDNAVFTNRYEYEILNNRILIEQEISATEARTMAYDYDRNRNRVRLDFGEATNGNQPNNNWAWSYDERDLPFQLIMAQGDPAQSTSEFDYDPNENMIRERHGMEGESPHRTTRSFDGYDRPVLVIDPMGNERTYQYDANNNLVRRGYFGQLDDVPGDSGNVKLFAENATYDRLNRLVRLDTEFFDVATGQALDDGFSTMSYQYNNANLLVAGVDDNGNVTRRSYDSYYRPLRFHDAAGNFTEFEYDALSNLIRLTEVDQSDEGGESETFVQQFEVDNLDRIARHSDNLGNTMEFGHDSRNNLTFFSDAKRTTVDGMGNVVHYEFDGLRRWVGSRRELTATGLGGAEVTDTISVRQRYDHSDRLVERTDDNGNVTRYSFDALDRMTGVEFADGTREGKVYDVHSNPIRWEDANGTVVAARYDLLNRINRRDITAGPGVAPTTTFEEFSYDGFGRMRGVRDDDSTIERNHTSTSKILSENLNGVVSMASFDGMDNMVECRYPSGLKTTQRFDRLNRLTRIDDPFELIADPSYLGRVRMEACLLGNGTSVVNEYDGDRRRARTTHLSPAQTALDDRSSDWDSMDNRVLQRDQLTGVETRFDYDSIYRVLASRTGANGLTNYEYDGVGNRRSVSGATNPGGYLLSEVAADQQVNQYTATPTGTRIYDEKGNLTQADDGRFILNYDYRNQLVAFVDIESGTTAAYRYDGEGRRIERRVVRDAREEVVRYFYQGMQVIEEQDEAGAMLRQYVYGRYVDEVVAMRTEDNSYFFHVDDNYNVRKVTDRFGTVVEVYDYDDFGVPRISSPEGQVQEMSGIGNPYLFQGRRFDDESGFYYYRSRYLDPAAGRFISRDYIGTWGDQGNLGNAYTLVGNNPQTWLDPSGMKPKNGERRPWDRTAPVGTNGHFHDRPLKGNDGIAAKGGEWLTRGLSVLGYVVPDVLEPNLVAAHEHYFEGGYDESNPKEGHFGFGAGTTEKKSDYNWQVGGTYSDDFMRLARDTIDNTYYPGGQSTYGMFTNNCQHYADSLREWYAVLMNILCSESGSGHSRKFDRDFKRWMVKRWGDIDVVITSD